jgi:hypothetical protein
LPEGAEESVLIPRQVIAWRVGWDSPKPVCLGLSDPPLDWITQFGEYYFDGSSAIRPLNSLKEAQNWIDGLKGVFPGAAGGLGNDRRPDPLNTQHHVAAQRAGKVCVRPVGQEILAPRRASKGA